jgi:hypothetical protein
MLMLRAIPTSGQTHLDTPRRLNKACSQVGLPAAGVAEVVAVLEEEVFSVYRR